MSLCASSSGIIDNHALHSGAMAHQCDRCGRPATVHEVTVHDGQKIERNLCQECASQEGIVPPINAPINELITKFVMSHGAAAKKQAAGGEGSGGAGGMGGRAKVCSACGITLAQFKQSGLLGCPSCYLTFADALGPLIERMQQGATHHTGKSPRRAGDTGDRHERIALLRKQLHDAIRAEQYERAAILRDQITRSGELFSPPSCVDPSSESGQ